MRAAAVRVCLFGLGVLTIVCAVAAPAFAQAAPVPEIDGNTIATGFAGLTAAALILKTRRRSQ